MNNVAFISW